MRTNVLTWLQNNADEKYRVFSAKLLLPETKLLGVRIPLLRQYAKGLIKDRLGEIYLRVPLQELEYQEELMLHALLLANSKMPTSDKIQLIMSFVPYINSWAVCDIFCADLKEIKKAPQIFYDTFEPLIKSQKEYLIRFFYVVALNYFITADYLPQIFTNLSYQAYVGYYDKMAAAWLISVAYVKFPTETEAFLLNTPLDRFVFRKSISKICDSFRVSKEAKIRLRKLASECKA